MAWHTVQETLKLTGKSRSQLYRDMAKGLVSYRTGKKAGILVAAVSLRFRVTVQVTLIYHNICYQHRLRGPQGVSDGKPVKQATNHPKTRQKRAGSVFTACMSMRTSA